MQTLVSKPNPHQFWQVSWASPCLHPSLTHAYRSTNDCLRKGDRHTDLSKLAPTRRFAFAGARLRGWGFLDGLVKTMFWDKTGAILGFYVWYQAHTLKAYDFSDLYLQS